MRTNIVIDDKLIKEAFRYTNATTKKDLITQALKEFIEHHRRKNVRNLKGKVSIDPNYNYKLLRTNKNKD